MEVEMINDNERKAYLNISDEDLINLYIEAYKEYKKVNLAFMEVKKIMITNKFVLNYYEGLDIARKEHKKFLDLLKSRGIEPPKIEIDIKVSVDDILDIVNSIYNKLVNWIEEHSYYYDVMHDDDIIDYQVEDLTDETLLVDSMPNNGGELWNKTSYNSKKRTKE